MQCIAMPVPNQLMTNKIDNMLTDAIQSLYSSQFQQFTEWLHDFDKIVAVIIMLANTLTITAALFSII